MEAKMSPKQQKVNYASSFFTIRKNFANIASFFGRFWRPLGTFWPPFGPLFAHSGAKWSPKATPMLGRSSFSRPKTLCKHSFIFLSFLDASGSLLASLQASMGPLWPPLGLPLEAFGPQIGRQNFQKFNEREPTWR